MRILNLYGLETILYPSKSYQQCGVFSSEFSLIPDFGNGKLIRHYFNGLAISFIDVKFMKTVSFVGKQTVNALELSILIEGEKIISVCNVNENLIQESQESYISFIDRIHGNITYHEGKNLKEINIRMFPEFIAKHQLDSIFSISKTFSINNIQDNFAVQLSNKTQEIATELFLDTRKGMLKRLFLEAKVLELLSLQMAKEKSKKNSDALVKKLYKVQSIIDNNLDIQYSIPQLAKKVLLNEFVLKKEFKRIFDITIFEYAMKQRMDKAKTMLNHTSKPIYEIADLVGYKNPTHFSAAFKKKEKMSPKKYRTQNCFIV